METSEIPIRTTQESILALEREILTPDVVEFLKQLDLRFEASRLHLLEQRAIRQAQFDAGVLPDFLVETKSVRSGQWRVAEYPKDIADRRVEITGPTDRRMVINALNSGAKVFMADFEDSTAPTWK